jgi:alkanesulfonate monooxygenase SsuD/methylene tetrahydromethanopterin reductase-like flavin-dependent oxidoreductase (luciferase family)
VTGGNSDAALRRAAALADGWYGFNLTVAEAVERTGTLAAYGRERGRAATQLSVAVAVTDASPADVPVLERAGVTQLVLLGSPPEAPADCADWVGGLAVGWND